MGVKCFEIVVASLVVGVVAQLLFCGACLVGSGIAEAKLETAENLHIVAQMAVAELLVGEVHEMPCVVGCVGEIVSSLPHGMLVASVETCLVHEKESCRGCSENGNR